MRRTNAPDPSAPKETVRRGYDALSFHYPAGEGRYGPWSAEPREHVPAGGAATWWSHTDAAEYRAWLTRTGLVVEREEFVPEGDGEHALFRARGPR